MDKLVSIVMPVKNAMPFLKECLDSILNQTYKNWELLAVDDSSNDHSNTLLNQYTTKDNRIQVLTSQGDGIISALQTGYKASKGIYIHRMDADDIMVPAKLKTLHNLLKKHGKETVATGHVRYFSKNGIGEGYRNYEKWLNALCDNQNHWQSIYKECVIASPCWMVHRDDFDKSGGFNSALYPEDYDLVFRFYKYGLKVVSALETLHLWRDHQSRTSRNHEHYQQNAFFKIKLHYFFQLDRDPERPLVVWGAGPKGKIMAKLLKLLNQEFIWVSNNPKKHGKEIYNQVMESYKIIITEKKPQVIVTVAQRNAQKEIITFLNNNKLIENTDFYLFR
ncbi:glycosyltransferase family 2 protein [Ascidiimonas sp. W6]|uniref:glycosyltransferase family 2 protein n=1 Tax=Ascidiimonas meishanensis TaxID=3128903 RepID=UPI0030EF8B0D